MITRPPNQEIYISYDCAPRRYFHDTKLYYRVKDTAEMRTAALTSLVSERSPVDWARYNYKKIGVGVMLIE